MAKKRNINMHSGSINNQSKNRIKRAIEELTKTRTDQGAMEQRLSLKLDKMLKEEMGTYLQTFDAMIIEHRVMKQIVMEKFKVSEDEWNKKYLEIKDKQKK